MTIKHCPHRNSTTQCYELLTGHEQVFHKSCLSSPYCQLLVRADKLKEYKYDQMNIIYNQTHKNCDAFVKMLPCVRVPYDNKTLLAHVSCHKPASILTSTQAGDWTAMAL